MDSVARQNVNSQPSIFLFISAPWLTAEYSKQMEGDVEKYTVFLKLEISRYNIPEIIIISWNFFGYHIQSEAEVQMLHVSRWLIPMAGKILH